MQTEAINMQQMYFYGCTFMAVLLWLPHKKGMEKMLIGRKYCVKHLTIKIFNGSSSTTNEPNFKIMCNYIHELLNIFEDPAQCVHAIVP